MGERVFGRYVNDACVKAGKKLLKEATVEKQKKADYGKKEIYQSAKEAATYLRNKSRGRKTMYVNSSYNCFECKKKGIGICHLCRNGSHFDPK